MSLSSDLIGHVSYRVFLIPKIETGAFFILKTSICVNWGQNPYFSRKDPTRYVEIRDRVELIDDPTGAFQLTLWKRMTGLDEFRLDPPGAERVIIKLMPEQVSTPTLYGGKLSRQADPA